MSEADDLSRCVKRGKGVDFMYQGENYNGGSSSGVNVLYEYDGIRYYSLGEAGEEEEELVEEDEFSDYEFPKTTCVNSYDHDDVCWVNSRLRRYARTKVDDGYRLGADIEPDFVYKRYMSLDVDDRLMNKWRGASFNLVQSQFKGKKLYENGLLSNIIGDHLITSDGHKVETNELMGKKYVLLYIAIDPDNPADPENPDYPDSVTQVDLELAYKELKEQRNPFETEIVFVPSLDFFSTETSFKAWSNKMPWLSVPFNHTEIRERLVSTFGKRWIILNPEGKVLQIEGEYIFHYFGAESYPFTDARIQEIKSQDARILEKTPSFSLKALLGSYRRDYLLSRCGDGTNTLSRVPISNLEGKTIGLLFIDICRSCYTSSFTRELEEVYDELKQKTDTDKSDFEIVFVHLPVDCYECRKKGQEVFDFKFQSMPWLALPYNDPACRRLWRMFHMLDKHEADPSYVTYDRVLAIVGPNGEFFERHLGAWNAISYGPKCFPFTQARAAEIEKAKLEALTLDSFFSKAGDFSLRSKHGEVPFKKLSGKKVIVLFAAYYCFKYSEFLRELKRLYAKKKSTHDRFEVIHVALDCNESSYEKCASRMPWLMYPYDKCALAKLAKVMFEDLTHDLPGLAVFGGDGNFLTRQRFLMDRVKMDPAGVFPFFEADNLCEQIIKGFPLRGLFACYSKDGYC